MAATSPESLRVAVKRSVFHAHIQRQKELELAKKERVRSLAREESIRQSLHVNPKRAGMLIVRGLLSEMKESAKDGGKEHIWRPLSNRKPLSKCLQQIVIAILKERGFRAQVRCGHGHKSWTTKGKRQVYVDSFNCDGTTYVHSCWTEVAVSW